MTHRIAQLLEAAPKRRLILELSAAVLQKILVLCGSNRQARAIGGAMAAVCVYAMLAHEAVAGHPVRHRAHLIEWSWGDHNSPQYVAGHIDFIETRPFDGMVISDMVGRNLTNIHDPQLDTYKGPEGVFSYEGALRSLSPLTSTTFKHFTQNFGLVWLGNVANPPELFDDTGWAIVNANAATYGRALKTTGLRGVLLDNEVYTYAYWMYPGVVPHKEKSLAEYVAQARKRGRELTQSFQIGYPEIVVIVLHGPYVGCTSAREQVGTYANDNFLAGAFAAGVIDAGRAPALSVDGGELYDYRGAAEFRRSYAWRKQEIAKRAAACPFMDSKLAASWHRKVSIGFGVFDKWRNPTHTGWEPITSMPVVEWTLRRALEHADKYVWHYSESLDWWRAPGDGGTIPAVTQDWIDAVAAARRG